VDSATWECPCGEKVDGPIQYFQHVKQRHQYDSLEQLVQQKTLRRVMQLYPPVCKDEIDIIEELDSASPLQLLQEVAAKREETLRGREAPLLVGGGRGTFGDMAGRFMEGLDRESPETALMLHFFAFLREFVTV
jgi:hypothetical protein